MCLMLEDCVREDLLQKVEKDCGSVVTPPYLTTFNFTLITAVIKIDFINSLNHPLGIEKGGENVSAFNSPSLDPNTSSSGRRRADFTNTTCIEHPVKPFVGSMSLKEKKG